MLRLFLGKTRMDKIRNEVFRGTAQVKGLGDKVKVNYTDFPLFCMYTYIKGNLADFFKDLPSNLCKSQSWQAVRIWVGHLLFLLSLLNSLLVHYKPNHQYTMYYKLWISESQYTGKCPKVLTCMRWFKRVQKTDSR